MPSRWAAHVAAAAHTFVDALDDTVTLDGPNGHHLARVLRLRPGEIVTAADGSGGWRPYGVRTVERTCVVLEACGDAAREPELCPGLTVAFALTKGAKPEVAVQKLTELGVDRMLLLRTERSVPRWDESRAGAALERLRRVAHEAASQSRRARLPEVLGPKVIEDLATAEQRADLVVADPRGQRADELPLPDDGAWLLVVGPEGGLTDDELGALPGRRLALGPHVLRAETAAIAGAAVLTSRRTTAA